LAPLSAPLGANKRLPHKTAAGKESFAMRHHTNSSPVLQGDLKTDFSRSPSQVLYAFFVRKIALFAGSRAIFWRAVRVLHLRMIFTILICV
jgi:hypothetical protein